MPTSKASFGLATWLLFVVLIISSLVLDTANAQQTVTVVAMPTSPHPPSYTSRTDFKHAVLRVTNEFRKEHDARPLVWNETLVKYARNWAEGCVWAHSHGPYGENLAYGYPNASSVIAAWGNEGEKYNYHEPTGFTEGTGHFTQLVWRATKEVGCAAVDCGYSHGNEKRDIIAPGNVRVSRAARHAPRAQGWFVVCEYKPPGNVVGRHDETFESNVRPGNSSESTSEGSRDGVGIMVLALGVVGLGMGLYT